MYWWTHFSNIVYTSCKKFVIFSLVVIVKVTVTSQIIKSLNFCSNYKKILIYNLYVPLKNNPCIDLYKCKQNINLSW